MYFCCYSSTSFRSANLNFRLRPKLGGQISLWTERKTNPKVKLPTVQTAELFQYVFDYFLATSPTTCTLLGSFNSPKISHNGKQQTMAASYLYLWLPVHDAVVTASTFAALSLMMCGFSVVGIPTCPMQMLEIVLVLCMCAGFCWMQTLARRLSLQLTS